MDQKEVEYFIEAALLAAGRPLNIDQLQGLFDGRSTPEKSVVRAAIKALNEGYEERGIEIAEVASGFRMQVKATMADRLGKLWEERPPRYSRALFETLALIAYRQPITRAEIEEVRGVSVSSNIMRSLVEREWVRVVGHRDVPGRPAMFGTTKAFLDYFSLKKLEDLPELADLSDWESLRVQLDLPDVDNDAAGADAVTADGDNVTELPVANEAADAAESADEAAEEASATDTESDDEALVAEDAAAGDEAAAVDVVAEAGDAEESTAPSDAETAGDIPELAAEAEPVEETTPAAELEAAIPELAPEAVADDIPELTEQTLTDLPDLSAADESAEIPELPTEDGDEEELKVSEWPDPVDSSSIATLETADSDPETGTNR